MQRSILFMFIFIIISCSQGPEVKTGDCVQRADRNDAWKVLDLGAKAKLQNTRTKEVKEVSLDSRWMISSCQ